MSKVPCGWAGCANDAEATLDRRSLCQIHFYDIATKCLAEYRDRLSEGDPAGNDRAMILKFVSELISETTSLVARTKFLGPEQRDKYLHLTLSSGELYRRVQREPRIPRNMPVLVCRESDPTGRQELTNTVNVSKRGACIVTNWLWKAGEKVCIQKPANQLKTFARVAWVKKAKASQFLIGLEILECEDFWKLELAAAKPKNMSLT